MRILALAAALVALAPLGAAAGAQPPRPYHGPAAHRDLPRHGWHAPRRHRVCRTVWRHHHRVRRCFYR